MPVRIQRKRTKDWRMPPGAVYVGRPTIWGNEYRVGEHGTTEECVQKYRELQMNPSHAADISRRYIQQELRGKDLACWCPLDRPCHADVLLEIANK